MIILGDACINYHLDDWDDFIKKQLSEYPVTIFRIHGNHEERPENIKGYELKKWHGGQVYYEKKYSNVLFAKDGEIFDFDGNKAVAIGGAYSVDKYYRLARRMQWFESEQLDEATKMYVESQLDKCSWKVDYVLSHAAPEKYEPVEFFLPFINQDEVDKIENKLEYEKWYLGHYHCEKDENKVKIMYHSICELGD